METALHGRTRAMETGKRYGHNGNKLKRQLFQMSTNNQQAIMVPRNRHVRLTENIQTGMIISKLQAHVLGDTDMDATQIQAARILMSKVLPDLKAVENQGDSGDSEGGWSRADLQAVLDGEFSRVDRPPGANAGPPPADAAVPPSLPKNIANPPEGYEYDLERGLTRGGGYHLIPVSVENEQLADEESTT